VNAFSLIDSLEEGLCNGRKCRNRRTRFSEPKGKGVKTMMRPLLSAQDSRWKSALLIATALLGLLSAKVTHAIVGIEGTFEYAFDAPWRIEPIRAADGTLSYGKIPIQLSIHDAMHSDQDMKPWLVNGTPHPLKAPATLGNVCSIKVSQTLPDGRLLPTHFTFEDLTEIEATWKAWKPPCPNATRIPSDGSCYLPGSQPEQPINRVCRKWSGESCTSFRNVSTTSEWHGLLWYSPRFAPWQEKKPGTIMRLGIEMQLTRDGSQSCASSHTERIKLYNAVSVYLGDAPLPRFGANWLYGDLHYHSQGSDNEGESAYNFRGVARALGALGMDFVFATDHASNSEQIMDADVKPTLSLDFHDEDTSRGVLRDMNQDRFEQSYRQIYGPRGVNEEASTVTGSGKAPQSVLSHGIAPQVFLGGELDVIPELGTPDQRIPYGNGLVFDLEQLCGGWKAGADQFMPCDWSFDPTEYVSATNDYLIRDIQGINQKDYGRLHLVYLPKQPNPDAFVASSTGIYGGASRRLTDSHNGQPSVLSDVARHGYAFIAHPMTASKGTEGPDGVPWSGHLLRKAWSSPSILGLEFWNEDARLRDNLEPSDEVGYVTQLSDLLPGDSEPVDRFRQGFETGLFELYPHHYLNGRWDEMLNKVEKTLAHGAFTWDQINQWGLNTRQTSLLSWLKPGEPRRFFMAGGSDAHGDFNYRRNGYFIRTTDLTDTAIGKPRNLVHAGRPGGLLSPSDTLAPPDRTTSLGTNGRLFGSPNLTTTLAPPTSNTRPSTPDSDTVAPVNPLSGDVPRHSQEQVVAALTDGHFSITDGPALRIVVDRNRNGKIDGGDTPMGGIVDLYGETSLPLLIEWKSTPEFGTVSNIDIYVGVSIASGAATDNRVYAPQNHGPQGPGVPGSSIVSSSSYSSQGLTHSRMYDQYWLDPTGDLRIHIDPSLETSCRPELPETCKGYYGLEPVTLNLKAYEASRGRKGDRFFVRAFARTNVLNPNADCPSDETDSSVQSTAMRRGGCIRRYAFTNPIWAVQRLVAGPGSTEVGR
jgi:hypothetical protein